MANRTESVLKPRVLFFHPVLPPYRVDVFNAVSEKINLRLVFFLENFPEQKFNQDNLRKRLKAEYGYLLKGFVVFGRIFRLGIMREINSFKPDTIITTEFSQATITVWLEKHLFGKRIKHVVMTDDNPERINGDNIIRKLIRRIVIPGLDGLIVVSDERRELFKKKYGANLRIASCPILQSEYEFRKKLSEAHKKASELVKTHNLYHKRVLLYVGRLADVKRVNRLINAFSTVCKTVPNAVLVIVGDGPERDILKTLVGSLGLSERIIFAGRCEGTPLYAWYRIGSLFVLTSEHEPFGCVVNEALISGMPVICSKWAGARTLIRDNRNGLVINPGNGLELQKALRKWLMKVKPVSRNGKNVLKPSRMFNEFDDTASQFVKILTFFENEVSQ